MSHGDRSVNALAVLEKSATKSPGGLMKSPSFALSDLDAYRRAFNAYDHLKNGTVVASDIIHVANRLGYRISNSQMADILESNGLTDSSSLTFESFLDLLPRNKKQISDDEHREAEIREKFRKYDIHQMSSLSLRDVQFALQSELALSPPTALSLLNKFIRLNYDQFIEFYKKVEEKKLEIYEKFGKFDTDKDGMISEAEAHEILHRDLGFTEEMTKALVKRFDCDRDGYLSYVEFGDFYMVFEESKAKIHQAFQDFDEDGFGYVPNARAEQILGELLGYSKEKCRQAIEMFDKNKDGNIDYEEFIDFYAMVEQETERLAREFHNFDQDKDGLLSLSDFQKTLELKGHSDDEVDKLVAGCNFSSGFLSPSEFRRFLSKSASGSTH